jgi:putative endonuclease
MSFAAEIGRIGEQMVANYLKKQGFIILRQNYRSEFGEIDIVAESEQLLLFVEVKTRSEDFLVAPADAVDNSKQNKIIKTANVFINRAYLKTDYRFDIAEVFYRRDELGEYHFSLNYIKDAFKANLKNDFLNL